MSGLNGTWSVEVARRAAIYGFALVFGTRRLEAGWSANLATPALEVDAWVVVEEHVKVVEGSAQLVGEYLELAVVVHHWENILFEEDEGFARVPDDAAVEVNGVGVSCCIQPSELAGANDLLSKHDQITEDLEKVLGQEGVIFGDVCLFVKSAG